MVNLYHGRLDPYQKVVHFDDAIDSREAIKIDNSEVLIVPKGHMYYGYLIYLRSIQKKDEEERRLPNRDL